MPGSPVLCLLKNCRACYEDAKTYRDEGADNIILENFEDALWVYRAGSAGPETIDSITAVAVKVSENVNIPIWG